MEMKIGGKYNWKHQSERLIFIGRNWSGNGYWNQFEKVNEPGKIWCEVLDADLHMLEETKLFVDCDFSQIESRTLAYMLSKDAEIDPHTSRACKEFECTSDKVTPEMRKYAKKLNYFSMYHYKGEE